MRGMGVSRVVVAVASVLVLGMAVGVEGCGCSGPALSRHDQAAFKRIDGIVSSFRHLEAEISADTIGGSKVRSRSEYVRRERPRIEELNRTA
jgi:hypothetical protein